MPTDNPKISLYVPQQIYTHFKAFQEERKLSMSQVGTVILAEYFGIELPDSPRLNHSASITKKTTIEGISLAEFTQLQQRVTELEVLLKTTTNNKTTNEPPKSTHQVDHQVNLTLAENQQ
jgi:hypothetical protein